MKYSAVLALALVGAAMAMPQVPLNGQRFSIGAPQQPSAIGSMGASGARSFSDFGGNGFGFGNTRNWGPQAYGPGLNNRWARTVNPFEMQQMVNMASRFPNTLVRVDVDGEATFTNRFGMEIDSPFEQYENMFEF